MKSAQASSMRAAALAASTLALLSPSAAAAGLKLRDIAPAPADAAVPGPAPGPVPAPDPIRPGIVVRITKSKDELVKAFEGQEIRYTKVMDEMLGKDFVVKEMKYGGAGIPSPDGTQKNTWYFPLSVLTPWSDTEAAKIPPVASQANRAVGLPTSSKIDIGPPGRHDAPWDYKIKHQGLMDPIAPPYNERVDLEKTAMPLPPWMKVKQVVSVECMDKLHKDPHHLCEPEAYVNYNAVTPTPTTEAPLTKKDAQALKNKIKRLESTIDSLSPKAPEEKKKAKITFRAPGVRNTGDNMNTMGQYGERFSPEDGARKQMHRGMYEREASDQRLHTAQGHGEPQPVSDQVVDQPL